MFFKPPRERKVSRRFGIMCLQFTITTLFGLKRFVANSKNQGLIRGTDGKPRCWWCGEDPQYVLYHDTEWGNEVVDDQRLFEKICLEGFQAGLSWLTILRKRKSFRSAFAEFDFYRLAKYRKSDVDRLVEDASIVRHRGKIESTINNAQRAIDLVSEFGSLHDYFLRFKPKRHPVVKSRTDIAATTPESIALSKDLKKRGWSFVGPTTCYAFMQAMGLVNDHLAGCHFRESKKMTN